MAAEQRAPGRVGRVLAGIDTRRVLLATTREYSSNTRGHEYRPPTKTKVGILTLVFIDPDPKVHLSFYSHLSFYFIGILPMGILPPAELRTPGRKLHISFYTYYSPGNNYLSIN